MKPYTPIFDMRPVKSIVTGDFVDYLHKNLLDPNPDLAGRINIDEWLTEPGLPKDTPQPKSDALVKVEIKITDTADHTETVTRTYPVSDQAVRVSLLPEGGVCPEAHVG